MTVLFLDFDGVTHAKPSDAPYSSAHYFEHVPALARVLEAFPEVNIVVSSSWQRDYTLTELAYQLEPLQPRVIGVTGHQDLGERYREIVAAAADLRRPWVAIEDDVANWDDADRARLIATEGHLGLGENGKLGELVQKLAAAPLVHRVLEAAPAWMRIASPIEEIAAWARGEAIVTDAEYVQLVKIGAIAQQDLARLAHAPRALAVLRDIAGKGDDE